MQSQEGEGETQQQKPEQPAIKLPNRPVRGYQPKCRPVNVISNHFKINLRDITRIYVSAIEIDPRIEYDNRKLKQNIVNELQDKIIQEMGIFLLTGFTMYTTQKPNFQNEAKFNTSVDDKEYVLTVKIKKTINVQDISEDERSRQLPALNFFNVLIKFFLKQLKFYETGRSCKFYDPTKTEPIQGTSLKINQGYETAVNYYQNGLFLRIDLSHKVIRTDNVLEQIKSLYNKNSQVSKDEKRNIVKENLITKIIVANYGNNRYWRTEDILFDQTCSQFMIDDGSFRPGQEKKGEGEESPPQVPQISIADYYKNKYNLIIRDDKQPLIMSKQQRQNKIAYLVPEFCTMTGIPEDFNDFQRKKVTNTCKKTAQQRIENLEGLARRMVEDTNQEEFMNPKKISDVIGVELSKRAERFQAKQLEAPKILFGKGEQLEMRDANFTFRQPVYDQGSCKEINIAIIHFKDCNLNEMMKCFQKTSNMMQINLREPKSYNIGDFNRKAFGEIEHILQNKIKDRYQCVLIVLPFQLKNSYGKIKQLCICEIPGGIISQVVMQNTLEKRGFQAIVGKLLNQIAAKVGATLWVAETPRNLPKKTILIGVDIENNKLDKQKRIVAVCASMNQTFTQFYTKIYEQQRGKEIIENIRQVIKDAVMAYFKKNKEVPENIIFFRDGIQENQMQNLINIELTELRKSFKWINPSYEPKLAMIVIQKQPQQKFFKYDGDNISNPPFGTLIDTNIVSKNYDFFLIAQNVTQGTAKPTHYRVIYDDSGLDEGVMQELVYSQCFNYSNWSGAIRVPAPVMYSHKLATLVASSLGRAGDDNLNYLPYYL